MDSTFIVYDKLIHSFEDCIRRTISKFLYNVSDSINSVLLSHLFYKTYNVSDHSFEFLNIKIKDINETHFDLPMVDMNRFSPFFAYKFIYKNFFEKYDIQVFDCYSQMFVDYTVNDICRTWHFNENDFYNMIIDICHEIGYDDSYLVRNMKQKKLSR